MYASCGTKLDECCADSECKDDSEIRKDIGACTSGTDKPLCAYARTKSTSGVEGVVRDCIAKSCGEKCMGDGRTHQNCTLHSAGRYCTCSNAERASGQDCSASKVGGNCIGTPKGCRCGNYECSGGVGDCKCDFTGRDGTSNVACEQSGTTLNRVCCLRVDDTQVSCECGVRSSCIASINEYEVNNCNKTTVMSALTNVLTDQCSR